MIDDALRKYLIGRSPVAAKISSRAYAAKRPENTALPCVVYHVIADAADHHLGGASTFTRATIQLDCIAGRHAEAKSLSDTLRNALDGYRGRMADDVEVRSCHATNRTGISQAPDDGSDEAGYTWSCDYQLTYISAVPTL